MQLISRNNDALNIHAYDDVIVDAQMKCNDALQHNALLQSHRNAIVPVDKIPPEILSYIFSFCTPQFEGFQDFGGGSKVEPDRRWLAFSHICSSWRQLALADPTLWTCPNFSDTEFAEAMMKRAGSVMLQISLAESEDLRVTLAKRPGVEQLSLASATHVRSSD